MLTSVPCCIPTQASAPKMIYVPSCQNVVMSRTHLYKNRTGPACWTMAPYLLLVKRDLILNSRVYEHLYETGAIRVAVPILFCVRGNQRPEFYSEV